MADSESRQPEEQTGDQPAPHIETVGEATEPETPVPTDLRRNIWLLVIIVGVILAAWVAALIWKGMPSEPDLGLGADPPEPGAPPPGPSAMPRQPQRRPRTIEPQPPLIARVIGRDTEVILASPARALPGGEAVRRARYFDVSNRADGFDMDQLIRLPRREADQLLTLTPATMPDDAIEPAADCTLLQDDDRVAVVGGTGRPVAYPIRLFRSNFLAVYGSQGDRQFCLTWHRATQCARAFVPRYGDQALTWRDSGLNYRGNNVFYDEETGSLWDGFSGLALTGPAAGAEAEMLQTEIWPWSTWRDAHPDGQVLVATLGREGASLADAANEELMLQRYLQRPSLPAPPIHFKPEESPLPAKAFVLGVTAGGETRAYPLEPLADAGTKTLDDTLGGVSVRIIVTSPRTARVEAPEEVQAAAMLWFAWKDSHPETDVYEVEGAQPQGATAAAADTPVATEPDE